MRILIFFLLAFPAFADFRSSVIYGDDNRIDAHETADPYLQSLAESSVALIPAANLVETGGEYVRPFGPIYGEKKNLCPEERFYSQETPSACSGVLVGEDLVLTAGHCINNWERCQNTRFVFGFRTQPDGSLPTGIPASDVYSCAEIIKKDFLDFSLIRLDRPTFRRPARPASFIPARNRLVAVGYPAGLPMKFAVNGVVRKVSKTLLKTNLDTFDGNSGSPVFNAEGRLEGIVVDGEGDFEKVKDRGCNVTRRCRNGGCSGESVLRSTAIFSRLGR